MECPPQTKTMYNVWKQTPTTRLSGKANITNSAITTSTKGKNTC
jgi:hypothetical protein